MTALTPTRRTSMRHVRQRPRATTPDRHRPLNTHTAAVALHLLTLNLLVLISTLIVPPPGQASSSLSDLLEPETVETLTVKDAVLRALEHNLDISISRHTRDIRLTEILREEAKFDPTVELSTRYDRNVVPLNRPIFGFGGVNDGTEPDSIDQNDTNVSLGLTQRLLSGGDVDVSFDTNRNSVAGRTGFLFNPAYTNTLSLQLTQPILRNFGVAVTTTQVQIARNTAAQEHHVFVNQVLEVIEQVEQAYWELVFARQNARVAKASLRAAKELAAANRAKADAGSLAEVEVLQAQAGVAGRVEDVLIARKLVEDQEDQLRRLFNPPEDALRRHVTVVPTDEPTEQPSPLSRQDAMTVGLAQRPEILQARNTIHSRTLDQTYAKNQLLPALTFEGGVGLRGLGNRPGDALDRTTSTDFYNVGGGLVLTYPLGNRNAESQYRRRTLETKQARMSLARTRQDVIVDIKEALRRVDTNFKRIRTTRLARELAEKQLTAERERLRLGLSTTRTVLEFQRDAAIAQGNEQRAVIDYNQALAHLRRSTGTTLSTFDIVVQ